VDWRAALDRVARLGAANRVVASKAIEAGLTFRPLEETIRDTLAWDAVREWPRAEIGISPELEQELIAEKK
jgi:2'-hydroxyisoflavone reductase